MVKKHSLAIHKKFKKIRRVSNIQRTYSIVRNIQTNNNKIILNELVERYEKPGVKPLSGRIKKSTEEAITFELGLSDKGGSTLNKWRWGRETYYRQKEQKLQKQYLITASQA